MTTHEANREMLIAAASRLFHKHGTGIPMEEVLRAAEVSEYQFREVYPTKEDLVAEVAERHMDRILAHLEPFVSKMERWEDLSVWREGVLQLNEIAGLMGCPVGVIALDCSPQSERALASVQRALTRFGRMHVKALARLKDRGVFVEAFEPRRAVQFAGAIIQGALLLSRAYQDGGFLERNFGTFLSYLETFRAPAAAR